MSSRSKGHSYERQLAKEYRELGFLECITSRAGDRSMDESGIDLLNTGKWLIQSKCYASFGSMDIVKALNKIPLNIKGIPLAHIKITSKGECVCLFKKDIIIESSIILEGKAISCNKILSNFKKGNQIVEVVIKESDPIICIPKKLFYEEYISLGIQKENNIIQELKKYINSIDDSIDINVLQNNIKGILKL